MNTIDNIKCTTFPCTDTDKNSYILPSADVDNTKNCSKLLGQEIALFPNVKVFMLMGDVAIKMMNGIWKKQTGKKVIPAGSTYKIRGQAYYYGDKRVLPSYTPAGKNFLIEKSKRKMVSDDIRAALRLIRYS